MSSSQPDPHGDVPELFPQDAWEDAGEMVKDTTGASTFLPPRKPSPENTPPTATDPGFTGLRIESTVQSRAKGTEEPALEVREIDSTVVRLEPEKPTQPKMPRHIEFHGKPPNPQRGADSVVWGLAKRVSLRWALGISFGIAALVITALSLLPLVNRPNAVNSDPDHALVVVEKESAPGEPTASYDDLITRSDEASRVFRTFMTASTKERVLPMVRNRKAIEPLILASDRAVLVSKRWVPENDARWEVHQTKGQPFGLLKGKLPDFSDFRAYFVIEDQQLRIDWKATTGYGTASFDELETRQGKASEIRGTLSPAGHHSAVFPETEFACYLFSAPDAVKAVWCYTILGEPVDKAVKDLFRGRGILKPSFKPHKVTLRLQQGPASARPNQWLIGEMLHKDWISP